MQTNPVSLISPLAEGLHPFVDRLVPVLSRYRIDIRAPSPGTRVHVSGQQSLRPFALRRVVSSRTTPSRPRCGGTAMFFLVSADHSHPGKSSEMFLRGIRSTVRLLRYLRVVRPICRSRDSMKHTAEGTVRARSLTNVFRCGFDDMSIDTIYKYPPSVFSIYAAIPQLCGFAISFKHPLRMGYDAVIDRFRSYLGGVVIFGIQACTVSFDSKTVGRN